MTERDAAWAAEQLRKAAACQQTFIAEGRMVRRDLPKPPEPVPAPKRKKYGESLSDLVARARALEDKAKKDAGRT